METPHAVFLLTGLLVLAIVLQPLARRLHIPPSALLVIAGFLASELMVGAGIDTGVRAGNFHDLVFFVFLPILIFESAYNIDVRLLLRNLLPVLFLAIPLMLLSALITAVLVYAGIAHPGGFPWIAALLTGALLSATDPVAVVALFREMGVPDRLGLLLEGESLFNDATAIVLFGVFLAMATGSGGPMTWTEASVHFSRVFFGGMLAGGMTGLVMAAVMKLLKDPVTRGVATVITAYLAFAIAESVLHVSGVMAVLVAGLVLGRGRENESFVQKLWEFNAWIANALVFLLVGVTITLDMFTERWLAMLIGIAGVISARAIGIFTCIPLLSRALPVEAIPRSYQVIMFWGGLRGAVTLALALSLPTSLDYWWTIQSIAFGVVLFTLFIQATTTGPLIRHYNLNKSN
ncbi:MAG: sodium:proton antiporter [Gammaproteobacteria bacterium]|nr:MAG: sodium:proton antiporter [Gammaproteobacteria bacterium]